METIKKELRFNIYHKLIKIINNYLKKVNIYDVKKYFKHKNNFNNLIKDIQYTSIEMINNDKEEYRIIVRKILDEIIEDKIAELKDYKTEKMITTFSSFLNENKLSIDFDKYSKIIYHICDDYFSKKIDDYQLKLEKGGNGLYYITLYQHDDGIFSIYIDYTEESIKLKSLTYKVILECEYDDNNELEDILEKLIDWELGRYEKKFFDIINNVLNFSNYYGNKEVSVYFKNSKEYFLITKELQEELDGIVERHVDRDKNVLIFLDYCSKDIQDKYRHLIDAKNFDLI